MSPTSWIAIASTASAVAALGSAYVALLSWWRDNMRESRAELSASFESDHDYLNPDVWIIVWNDGPGPAYSVEATAVAAPPDEERTLQFKDEAHALGPGSSEQKRLANRDRTLPPRTRLTLTWEEQVPDLPPVVRRVLPGGRSAGTRQRRRRVLALETGALGVTPSRGLRIGSQPDD